MAVLEEITAMLHAFWRALQRETHMLIRLPDLFWQQLSTGNSW